MAEVALDTYAVNASNTAAGTPNLVAAVSDGTGNRQIVALGAGDGTATMVDGTPAHPLNANSVQTDNPAAAVAFTITLASLASSVVGVGRQSTLITGNTARSALVGVKITTGTTPTINTLVYVYLIRGDGTINDDGAGATDAAITVINAPLLGTILVPATTTAAAYTALFDTKFLGSLGPTWGIAIVNSTVAALNATAGNFTVEYRTLT